MNTMCLDREGNEMLPADVPSLQSGLLTWRRLAEILEHAGVVTGKEHIGAFQVEPYGITLGIELK